MTKAIAINPAKRKSKSKSKSKRKSKRKTNPKGGTVAAKSKKNPARRAPRRNQAFKITPTDARNLGMSAAGGAVGGAVTGYLDEMKPEALAMVPTELLTAGAGLLIVAMSKQPAAKAIAAGMIGYAAGSMVEKFTADATTTTGAKSGTETTEASKSLDSLYALPNPYKHTPNPYHSRTNVGALISVV